MRNLLAVGVGLLAKKLLAHAGLAAIYRRPAGVDPAIELPVTVTPGQSLLRVGGDVLRSENDFLLPFTDLQEAFSLPRRGDQLILTTAGVTATYELRPPTDIDDCYRLDPHSQLLRLFTKLVGTATPSE